jgi:hypothetical protein
MGDLAGLDLAGLDLAGADLAGRDLTGARLRGARLAGARLRGARLEGADLDGARLAGADLAGARLAGATLRKADLTDAVLTDADATGADLAGARLAGADLDGAVLRRASLARADLRDASLWNAVLAGADLRGSRLGGADVDGADFEGARVAARRLPPEWRLEDGRATARLRCLECGVRVDPHTHQCASCGIGVCPFCGNRSNADPCRHVLAEIDYELDAPRMPWRGDPPRLPPGVTVSDWSEAQRRAALADLADLLEAYEDFDGGDDGRSRHNPTPEKLFERIAAGLTVPFEAVPSWNRDSMASSSWTTYYTDRMAAARAEVDAVLARLRAGLERLLATPPDDRPVEENVGGG